MKMNLTDEEIRKEYEKRIIIFTLKNGKTPKRTKLFNYLFAILNVKTFNPSNVVVTAGSRLESFDRTAVFSKFYLSHLINLSSYDVLSELRKKDFTRYIGEYELEYNYSGSNINIHYNRSGIRWDLIDYYLRKYRPDLIRENKNSFHILKNSKWIQKTLAIQNHQLTLI